MTFILKKKEQVPQSFDRFVNDIVKNVLHQNEEVAEKQVRALDPKINILEKGDDYEIHFALPGWTKSDIDVQVDQEELIVKGEKEMINTNEATFHNYEFDHGRFEKRFDLPEEKFGEVNATMKEGILIVSIQKKVKKETNKKITVS